MYNAGSTIKFREALECFGRACSPMSPEQSIKNSCCETNIWRRLCQEDEKSSCCIVHYHEERNHQGKDNRILFPSRPETRRNMGAVRCRERLGGTAEVLRKGSGIKVDGTAGHGPTI